jgi:rhomboid protease GluP
MEQERKPFIISRQKPYVTYIFIGLCSLIFIADYASRLYFAWKYNYDIKLLTALGVKSNELIIRGQWWRLVSAIFLHGDLSHIGFNMLALFIWGRHIEALYGKWRYVVIFMLAGLLGSAASFAFTSANSLGASGAIYGLFGALLYFRKYDKSLFDRIFGVQVLIYIAFSLFLGFTQPYVDNTGHIGGIIGGYMSARSVGLLSQMYQKRKETLIYIGAYSLVFIILIVIGIYR